MSTKKNSLFNKVAKTIGMLELVFHNFHYEVEDNPSSVVIRVLPRPNVDFDGLYLYLDKSFPHNDVYMVKYLSHYTFSIQKCVPKLD